jgi:hypothetical protein
MPVNCPALVAAAAVVMGSAAALLAGWAQPDTS